MITEKELISKLQELKQIKPRNTWVVLAKSDIFSNKDNVLGSKLIGSPSYKDVLSNIFRVSFQRKFAYSLAAFLFVALGVFSFIQYGLPNPNNSNVKTAQKPESLVAIKSDVEDFKIKSKSLSQIATLNSQDISFAVKEVEDAAKELTDAIKKDPQLAKEVALDINNNKTYLNIQGGEGDLQGTLNVLYKTTVEQLVKDFDDLTLTESQQESLDRIKGLLNQTLGNQEQDSYNFTDGLEDLLLLNAAVEEK